MHFTSAADWCMNCAFCDKSMKIGMQLEQVLRRLFLDIGAFQC